MSILDTKGVAGPSGSTTTNFNISTTGGGRVIILGIQSGGGVSGLSSTIPFTLISSGTLGAAQFYSYYVAVVNSTLNNVPVTVTTNTPSCLLAWAAYTGNLITSSVQSNGAATSNMSPPAITPPQTSSLILTNFYGSTAPGVSTPANFTLDQSGGPASEPVNIFSSNTTYPAGTPASISLSFTGFNIINWYTFLIAVTSQVNQLTPTNPTVTIPKGGSCAPVNIISSSGLGGVYGLTPGPLPPGLTYSWGGNSGATGYLQGSGGSATLIICTGPNTPVGTYPITITGTPVPGNGATGGTQTTTITVTVGASGTPDFSLTGSLVNVPLSPKGSSQQVMINLGSLNGFSGAVTLSMVGLPSGVTAVFTPAVPNVPANGIQISSVVFTAASGTALGVTPVTMHAVSGGLTHDMQMSIIIQGGGQGSSSRRPKKL